MEWNFLRMLYWKSIALYLFWNLCSAWLIWIGVLSFQLEIRLGYVFFGDYLHFCASTLHLITKKIPLLILDSTYSSPDQCLTHMQCASVKIINLTIIFFFPKNAAFKASTEVVISILINYWVHTLFRTSMKYFIIFLSGIIWCVMSKNFQNNQIVSWQ